jgi:hypothetical protein
MADKERQRAEPDRRAARPFDPAGILDALAPRMPAGDPQTCRTDDPARVRIARPRPARILPVPPVSISASGPVRVTTTFPSTLRNALPLSSCAMSASHRSPPPDDGDPPHRPVPGGDRVAPTIPLPDPAITPDLSTKLVAPARHTALSEDEGARAEPMIATVAGG